MSEGHKLYFCTIFDSAYLSKGIAMYDSLERCCPEFHLYVFAFDENCKKVLKHLNRSNISIIALEEFENKELIKAKYGRTREEYCWTATPSAILFCLKNFNIDHCTYVDADLCFYSDPNILFDEMGNASVIITEHRYSAFFNEAERYGKYCVQYMTFRNDLKGLKALNWWNEKCLEWCYNRVEPDRFGDQRYLDDWTERFDGIHVLRHPGAGIASWNIQDFRLYRKSKKVWVRGESRDDELIFYHFSNIQRFFDGTYVLPRTYLITGRNRRLLHSKYIRHLSEVSKKIVSVFPEVDPDGCVAYFPTEIYTFRDKIYIARKLFVNALKKKDFAGFMWKLHMELAKGYYSFLSFPSSVRMSARKRFHPKRRLKQLLVLLKIYGLLSPSRQKHMQLENEKRRIMRMPRYTEGVFKDSSLRIKFTDSSSFLASYEEIFINHQYNFTLSSERPNIIDCGANIGISLIYFKLKYPNAVLTGFEPDKKIYRILQENMEYFGRHNVSIYNKAVWDKETTLKFNTDGADSGRVLFEREEQNGVEVETVRLSQFLDKPVDLLIMDIEGSEYTVIKDCRDRLCNAKNLFIEYHSYIDQTQRLDEILAILSECGFRYYIYHNGPAPTNPFIGPYRYLKMDNQVKIYATREVY